MLNDSFNRKNEINKMNIYWAGNSSYDFDFVEIYYDEKYLGKIWKDSKSNEMLIDFSMEKCLDTWKLLQLKIKTLELLLEIAMEVYNGDAYFDCGFYTKANKTE